MVNKSENIIVGISIGDLNGIGPEVILKTFEDARMLEFCTPVIFGNVRTLSFIKKQLDLTLVLHGIDQLDQIVPGKINVINIWKEPVEITPGQMSPQVGQYAVKSFVAAVSALNENKIDVLVTAPIHKYAVQSEEFSFPGHTEYLDRQLEGNALMLMIKDTLRVGLLTDHVPVNEVAQHLSAELIRTKIQTISHTLVRDFSITKPRIAVLGLNPHAGDGGVIGSEDRDIIAPVVRSMFEAGTLVFGPFPADGFFGSGAYKKYDAVIASYHDQGLIPFKTLAFGGGVNFTAGLNRIRTSPDHGTAFDIAGKGVADHHSFKEAVYLALDIYHSRAQHSELTRSPLKVKEKPL